jgi:hypothetical protein
VTIDSKTKISLFSLAAVVPTLFTCIYWIASLSIRQEIQDKDKEKRIAKLEQKVEQKEVTDQVLWLDVRERLIRLELIQGAKSKGVRDDRRE